MLAMPVGAERLEDFSVLAARFGRARTLAHIERLALGITEREPQIARTPITGDEGRQVFRTWLMACTCRRSRERCFR